MTRPAAAAAFPLAPAEGARLAALREYDLFEQVADVAFEELTALAARLCGTSLAYLSLVGERAVWLTAARGRPSVAVPREHAYCTHAAFADDIFVVPDAARDDRLAASPSARAEGAARFYAGARSPRRTGTAWACCACSTRARATSCR